MRSKRHPWTVCEIAGVMVHPEGMREAFEHSTRLVRASLSHASGMRSSVNRWFVLFPGVIRPLAHFSDPFGIMRHHRPTSSNVGSLFKGVISRLAPAAAAFGCGLLDFKYWNSSLSVVKTIVVSLVMSFL